MRFNKTIAAVALACAMTLSVVPATVAEASGHTETYVSDDGAGLVVIGQERIAVSIGDSDSIADSGILTVRSDETGQLCYIRSVGADANMLAFEKAGLSDGTYTIVSLQYFTSQGGFTIDFGNYAKDCVFGINTDIKTKPDGYITENTGDHCLDDYVGETGMAVIDAGSANEAVTKIMGATVVKDLKGLKNGKVVVVLDAGHDDSHVGARREPILEEKLNIKIAQACYQKLSQYSRFDVYMTRTGDACPFPDATSSGDCNRKRVQYAASVGADLYVALHLNVSTNATARGAEVYIPNQSLDPEIADVGKTIANSILKSLETLGVTNRGARPRNSENGTTYSDGSIADYYTVVMNSKLNGFPGFIVEHCFLDNPEDYQAFLSTDEKLRALGEADAVAIADNLTTLLNISRNYYDPIFNAQFYRDKYPDVAAAFSADDRPGMLDHFLTIGQAEGRQGCASFDVRSYFLANPDLRKSIGKDWPTYYQHFLDYGQFENRPTANVTRMEGATTVYKGKDYSAVYDYNYYVENNPDIRAACPDDDESAIAHFITYGIGEGRGSKETFQLKSYYNANPDLRKAFGRDYKKLLNHYYEYGRKESRVSANCPDLIGYSTVVKGIDYSDVYDYNYYMKRYPDLQKAFGNTTDDKVLAHFIDHGMGEKRRASEAFDVEFYMANNADLRAAFGDKIAEYYKHYIEYGKKEGRPGVAPAIIPENPVNPVNPTDQQDQQNGIYPDNSSLYLDESKLYSIMGYSSCSVDQMMKYFSNSAEYPLYYATSDAPDLRSFCQMYLDECTLEGVKAEVAFCQMIQETGYLKYGYDVTMDQYNFAGIGATGGVNGNYFPDVRSGIRAQVQHLKAYASSEPLYSYQVDPRFEYVDRGSARFVEHLGIHENPRHKGWATQENYGINILNRINKLLAL